MLSVAVGYDCGYLTSQVAAGREGYYTGAVAAGEPPGRWSGPGADALGLSGEVDAQLMEAIYHRLCDPRDPYTASRETWIRAEKLGAPPKQYRSGEEIYQALLAEHPDAGPERRAELKAQAERSARQPVAFLDATFSAPKSVSLLGVAYERAAEEARRAGDLVGAARWAGQARAVEDAVRAGAAASIAHLQARAGLARVGHHGGGAGRWVDAGGWVVASFLQHDSRDHDPQLHVHQAILNRQLCADGQWRAVDSRAIHRERGAAAAIGERVMEAALAETLGVVFDWRRDGRAREIAGVSEQLCQRFSSRRRTVTERAGQLIEAFTARFGREPSPAERDKIMRQATLATRAAKSHTGETLAERLDRWQAEAGRDTAEGLAQILVGVREAAARAGEVPTWSPRDVTQRALALVADRKAAWTRSDLLRAVSDSLPAQLGVPADQVAELLDGLTAHALQDAVRLTHEETTAGLPARLLRSDGSSVYDSGQVFYAAPWQLAAEKALAERAADRGAEAFTDAEIEQVLTRGRVLGPDQQRAVRGILGGGAAIDVLKAPAGTGKSYVVGVLAEAWTDQTVAPHSPARRVFGLSTAQNAANVLAGEGLTDTANIAAWSLTQRRLDTGHATAADEAYRLRADDLVVVDEAGMVDTPVLAEIAERCRRAGAKLLLTGDPKQLGAVGAGGALAELFAAAPTHELVEVRRFDAPWEGPASLRLRDGDMGVIAEYATRGRLVDGGAVEQTEQAAARAWLADYLAGRDTVLLAGSNDAATRLNAQLRAELIRLGQVSEQGVELGHSGETAGVGDLVTARRNGRSTGMFTSQEAPVNRDQYRVLAVEPGGGLRVARVLGRADGVERHAEPTVLPAEYVAEHVSLGYAATVHSVQGRTTDTSHVVVAPGADPAAVYVGLSRGRARNTAYAVTRPAPGDQPAGATLDTQSRTPEAVVADAMTRRDLEAQSATGVARESAEQAAGVHTQLDRLSLELAEATAGRTSRVLDRLAAEGRLSAEDRVALAGDQQTLQMVERLLRVHELAGRDPERVLADAAGERGFAGARNPGAVLYSRLQHPDLAPRLTDYSDLVPAGLDEATRGRLLELAGRADERRRELGARVSAHPPAWALEALGPVPEDVFAAAEWERKAGWAAACRELTGWADERVPLGPDPGAIRAEHRAAWRVAHAELDLPDSRAEEAELSEAQHRARVEAWRREQRWAPAYVDEPMTATALAADRAAQDTTIFAGHAAHRDGEPAVQLAGAAEQAHAQHLELRQRHEQLEAARDARARWLVETAVTADKAERSRAHLAACGVDVDTPDDRVTAAEWLAEHQRATAIEDAYRPVTEADLDDTPRHELPAPDGPVLETAVPDIREVSRRHPSEDSDPARAVPEPDVMAVIAERAAAADREITARAEAEEAERREREWYWHACDEADRDQADEDVLAC